MLGSVTVTSYVTLDELEELDPPEPGDADEAVEVGSIEIWVTEPVSWPSPGGMATAV